MQGTMSGILRYMCICKYNTFNTIILKRILLSAFFTCISIWIKFFLTQFLWIFVNWIIICYITFYLIVWCVLSKFIYLLFSLKMANLKKVSTFLYFQNMHSLFRDRSFLMWGTGGWVKFWNANMIMHHIKVRYFRAP